MDAREKFIESLEALSAQYDTDEYVREFVDNLCVTYGLPSIDELAAEIRDNL